MLFSTACRPEARGCRSKEELRFPRRTDSLHASRKTSTSPVFRDDIGQAATVGELEALSGKKRAARLDAIREACQNYINGPLLEQLSGLLRGLLETAKQAPELGRVEADPEDPDHQELATSNPTPLKTLSSSPTPGPNFRT
jgi:hypothetical protein